MLFFCQREIKKFQRFELNNNLNSTTIDELGEGVWKDNGASSTRAEGNYDNPVHKSWVCRVTMATLWGATTSHCHTAKQWNHDNYLILTREEERAGS